MKNTCLLLLGLIATSCNSPSVTTANSAAALAPASPTQKAVETYVQTHAATFPGYEAVGWGQPLPYTKTREAAIKGVVAMKVFDDALVPRNKALDVYKAAVARHAPAAEIATAKARYGKANKYNDSLLVIANSFIGVHDSARLGTEIAHMYRAKNKAGTLVLDSTTFVVYRNGKVEQL